MMTQSAAQSKSTVHIDIIDPRAGIYAALSSDGERWYAVNVAARTCSCPAGAHGFTHCRQGACRHLIAARVVARGLASMTPAERVIASRLQNIRVHVERVDVAALNVALARRQEAREMGGHVRSFHLSAKPQTVQPSTSRYHTADALLDAFGINP